MSDTVIPEPVGRTGRLPRLRRSRLRLLVLVLVLVLLTGLLLIPRGDDSPSTSALLGRALAAHVDGRLHDAELLYRRILAADPTDKLANYNLGLVAQTEGRVVEADRSYHRALAADPAYAPALFNLAVLKYEADLDAEAIALYRQVISIDPTNAAAHLNLGHALRRDGQLKAGNDQIALAIAMAPDLAAHASEDATPTTTAAASRGVSEK